MHTSVELHNGTRLPLLGLGTFQMKTSDELFSAISAAIDCGYTLFGLLMSGFFFFEFYGLQTLLPVITMNT